VHKSLFRVFAGNRAEYAEFLDIFQKGHNDSRYITGPEQLRGLPRGTPVFLVGNYRDNKHFRDVYEQVIIRDLKIIEVNFK
jgi:hypothetical protein